MAGTAGGLEQVTPPRLQGSQGRSTSALCCQKQPVLALSSPSKRTIRQAETSGGF